jgi:hypothetical protein
VKREVAAIWLKKYNLFKVGKKNKKHFAVNSQVTCANVSEFFAEWKKISYNISREN